MAVRLGHIDRNLRAYAEALRTYPRPPQRDRVLATIDDLLDQRLAVTGPPAEPAVILSAAPHGMREARAVCPGCGTQQSVRLIPPAAPGAGAVWLIDCSSCDYTTCRVDGCGSRIRSRTDRLCPAGHEITFRNRP